MKTKRIFFLYIFIQTGAFTLHSQTYIIDALVSYLPSQTAYLYSYSKFNYELTDSAEVSNGSFYFSLNEEHSAGMKQIRFNNTPENTPPIEFVWNKENISIESNYNDINKSLQIHNSIENDLLAKFYSYDSQYQQKMNILLHTLDNYPEDDEFYQAATQQLSSIQVSRNTYIDQLVATYPSALASKIMAKSKSAIIPASLNNQQRLEWIQENYFKYCPIDDPALNNTPFYGKKIIEFLKINAHPSMTYAELEEVYKSAVDAIMSNTGHEMKAGVVEYLMEGFERLKFERVQSYLYDNYVDESCTTDKLELAKERIEAYKKMAIGEQAPDIAIYDIDKKPHRLSTLDSDYTLVLFWATHCHHCNDMMPKLIRWYKEEKPDNLEVFAVSIDTVPQNWRRYSEEMAIPFINALEPIGWEGISAANYNIYATPSMFILNKNREIVARPITFRELKALIKKMNL